VLVILMAGLAFCAENTLPDRHYMLTKAGPLIDPPGNMPADKPTQGPYYTCLMKMGDVEGLSYEYALYYSTDHSKGDGGIWLYLCNGNVQINQLDQL
jgi:hypothetical protein